jgi:hypothetical protein
VKSRPNPPPPENCLVNSRRLRFRGGTLIVPDVHELDEHERRLHSTDGYRPATCPRCGGERLHVHDHLRRVLVDEARVIRIGIVRYICARADCGATWRMLPAFVARHLWRRWTTVARAIAERAPASRVRAMPARTTRRWHARLASAARQLVLLLSGHDDEAVARFASVVRFDSTRRQLIEFFTAARVLGAHALEDIASALHALEPGVRLM